MKKSNFSPQATGHFEKKLDLGDMLNGPDTGDPPAGHDPNLDDLSIFGAGASLGH